MRLRIPAVLVFTLTASCGEESKPPPTDGSVACDWRCTSPSGGDCHGETVCVDDNGECPTGCVPEPIA